MAVPPACVGTREREHAASYAQLERNGVRARLLLGTARNRCAILGTTRSARERPSILPSLVETDRRGDPDAAPRNGGVNRWPRFARNRDAARSSRADAARSIATIG